MTELCERIAEAVSTIRCPAVCEEEDLHALAAAAFAAAGLEAKHEAPLGRGARIDFLIGDVGVELKKGRPSPSALRRQLTRYAASESISELLVVTSRGVDLPKTAGGKPVYQIALERLWGIGLP